MPTDKRRIAAYLPDELEAAFQKYKKDNGIPGDSQAIISIFTEFFGATHSVAYLGESPPQLPSITELDRDELKSELQSELKEELANELQNELLGELRSELKSELADALAGSVVGDIASLRDRVEAHSEWIGEGLTDRMMELIAISLAPLREQLDKLEESELSKGSLSELKDAATVDSEVVADSDLSSEMGSSPLRLFPNFQNGDPVLLDSEQLAERFDIPVTTVRGRTTPSRYSPDKFLEWTMERDPDGIPWIPHASMKPRKFVPSEEISGEQKENLTRWLQERWHSG